MEPDSLKGVCGGEDKLTSMAKMYMTVQVTDRTLFRTDNRFALRRILYSKIHIA